MSDLVRGKKRKKRKKGKAQELGKLFLLALSHKELQERPTTKPRLGPSSAQPGGGTKPLSVQCLLDLLAASLTFSVLSSRCELLTRS